MASADDVRQFVLDQLDPQLRLHGIAREDLRDDFDLRSDGLVDSIGFLDVLTAVEERFGVEVDFDDVSIEELTVMGPFCRRIADQATGSE